MYHCAALPESEHKDHKTQTQIKGPTNESPQRCKDSFSLFTPLHSITHWNGCRSLGGVRGGVCSLLLGPALAEARLTGGPRAAPSVPPLPCSHQLVGLHPLPTDANVRRGMCSLVGRSFLPTVSPRHPERRTQGVVYISVPLACGQWEVHKDVCESSFIKSPLRPRWAVSRAS